MLLLVAGLRRCVCSPIRHCMSARFVISRWLCRWLSQEDSVRSRKTAIAVVALLCVQFYGILAVGTGRASAETTNLVAVLSLYTSQDDCSVQYRRSTDGHWGEDTVIGPPVACQGGLVVTELMSQEEANQEVASASAARGTEAQISASLGTAEVRIVQLSGDDAVDEAAIDAEVLSLHESVAPEGIPRRKNRPLLATRVLPTWGLKRCATSRQCSPRRRQHPSPRNASRGISARSGGQILPGTRRRQE